MHFSSIRQGWLLALLSAGFAGCPGRSVQPDRPRVLDDYRGSIVLLHFFSDHDAGGRAALVEVREFHKKWTPRDVPTLGFLIGPGAAAASEAYAREMYVEFPVAPDRAGLAGRYKVRATPTSIILDRIGRTRFRFEGHVSREDLERKVLSLLVEEKDPRADRWAIPVIGEPP